MLRLLLRSVVKVRKLFLHDSYESNRGRSLGEVRDETRQVFQQLLAVVEVLPDDVRIEEVRMDRMYYLVWLGDERFPAGEFFDHFHDDHEPDVRAWLARMENGSFSPPGGSK